MKFTDYLRLKRSNLAMSQTEVADILGVSLSTLQKWEAGDRRPKPLTENSVIGILNNTKPNRPKS